jgi:glycosyltransferase involved in cell wall biosynthesis
VNDATTLTGAKGQPSSFDSQSPCELSVVMPCLNEAETVASCIDKATLFLERTGIRGEIIIADNGSTDGSRSIAVDHGARVVDVAARGYGCALAGGINAAEGRYIIMGDADESYDFLSLDPFIEKLREGYELVMGNRFQGGIEPKAMPPLHRYLGNPVLSGVGRLFFHSPVGDFHCGLRGFDRAAIVGLDLRAPGMEFASEMVVKATQKELRIIEVPTTLSPDGRSRSPHLRSFRDGWRHLRFLLLNSPRWLFAYPGIVMAGAGLIVMLVGIIKGPFKIGSVTFEMNTLLFAALSLILGMEVMLYALYLKVYAVSAGSLPETRRIGRFLDWFTLEKGLLIGAVPTLLGVACLIYAFLFWESRSFGQLVPSQIMRITIPSVSATVVGINLVFSSFLLAAFTSRRKQV